MNWHKLNPRQKINSIFRIPLTKIHRTNHRHAEKTHLRERRSPFFGDSLFDGMFGMNDMFDPMKIFDHAFDGFDDGFGFDIPFKFPPMDPLWPFHSSHHKFNKPGRNDKPEWNDNHIPDDGKNHPPTDDNGNRVYLRNFNDVNCVLLRSKFLHVFNLKFHK